MASPVEVSPELEHGDPGCLVDVRQDGVRADRDECRRLVDVATSGSHRGGVPAESGSTRRRIARLRTPSPVSEVPPWTTPKR